MRPQSDHAPPATGVNERQRKPSSRRTNTRLCRSEARTEGRSQRRSRGFSPITSTRCHYHNVFPGDGRLWVSDRSDTLASLLEPVRRRGRARRRALLPPVSQRLTCGRCSKCPCRYTPPWISPQWWCSGPRSIQPVTCELWTSSSTSPTARVNALDDGLGCDGEVMDRRMEVAFYHATH
jgi:hypothetical protein